MINISSVDSLKAAIQKAHPSWDKPAVSTMANDFIKSCDPRLESIVEDYLSNNKETDITIGEFNIFLIRAMRGNCSFIDAVALMDAYIKDPVHGKALITRRSGR